LYRGYDNGKPISEKVAFKPTLFVPSKKKTNTLTIFGECVEPVYFESISKAKDYCKTYEDVANFSVHGMRQFAYQYIAEEYPNEIEYDLKKMRTWVIDIECKSEDGFPDIDTANEAILLIAIRDHNSGQTVVFGTKSYNEKNNDKFVYKQFKDEYSMLKAFVTFWNKNFPDNVTGWNIEGFDIPYLINRIRRILGDEFVNKLSPWGIVNSREIFVMMKSKTVWDIIGVNIIDYLDLYQKFTYNKRESYSLQYISTYELGEAKHQLGGTFKDSYTNHWDDFVRYNARDAELVSMIDKKLNFLEILVTVAFLAKCQFKDVFGPVRVWDVLIFNHLRNKNIVIPDKKNNKAGEFEGAWVKDPLIGMFGWVVGFDFTSLYPNILMQWNMSPDTLYGIYPEMDVDSFIEGNNFPDDLIQKNLTIAANGAMFKRDKMGIVPEVVQSILDSRKLTKKKMLELERLNDLIYDDQIASLDAKQMAFKILANALYGALSNPGFRYYDLRIAEAVTKTGQASDRHIVLTINKFMNEVMRTENEDYIIAGDTDSVYLNIDPLVKQYFKPNQSLDYYIKAIDKICEEKIQPEINASVKLLFDRSNGYKMTMSMKREAIASKAIWTAKKRYAMMVHDSEGVRYEPYYLKVMGLDLVKSSTPSFARDKLLQCLKVIFEQDQRALYDFVGKTYDEFIKTPVEEISFPRSANDIDKYADSRTIFGKKCPIHVRGALLMNHAMKANKDFTPIKKGDKVKFVYLRLPNPIRNDVISFPSHDTLPASLGLHKYIDYDKQWETAFMSPLKGITDAIKWKVRDEASLEDFFV
jgi:DNA polymerase elongation subunit (family B)